MVPTNRSRNPSVARVCAVVASFAKTLEPLKHLVVIAIPHSVVVTVEKVKRHTWVVVIKKVLLLVMMDTEAVHPAPRLHIRGREIGAKGGEETVELEKIRRKEVRMFLF